MRTVEAGMRFVSPLALFFLGAASQAFPAAITTTSLSINASGSPAATISSGTVVTLTATVNAGATPVTPGQVNFCDATAAYCSDIHLLATAQLTTAGTAIVKFAPGAGNHSYKAVFVGTNTYAGSSSAMSALAVTNSAAYPSTTTIASGGIAGNYTLTATVVGAGSSTSAAPTGTVSFLDTSNAGSAVGTAALGAGTASLDFLNAPVPETSGSPELPAVGDFNGDGKADLALVDSVDGAIYILLGNGDGTFTTGRPVTTSFSGGYPVVVGDFNGDGKADLLVESFSGIANYGTVTALLGNGDGTFTAAADSMIDPIPGQLAAGDFNNDGKQDLAVLAGTKIAILLGRGDGTFAAAAALSPAAGVINNTSLTVGDFNGDGKLDLAVMGQLAPAFPTDTPNSPIMVFLGKGDGTFTVAPDLMTCCNTAFLVSGDFNGDGKTDLVVSETGSYHTGEMSLFLGNGDGTFAAAQYSGVGGFTTGSIGIGDFNGDGNADLAISARSQGVSLVILLGNGAGTFAPAPSLPATNPTSLAIGDFDGSGTADLALSVGSKISILLSQTTQTATAAVNGISPAGPGTHQIEASYPGDGTYSGSVSTAVGLTGTPTAAITFSVPNHTYGDAPFPVAATSISTGAFSYSVVSGSATIAGSTVTLTKPGSVVLQASQAAADGYEAATQTASFTVGPAFLTISANNLARVFGATVPPFTGTVVGAINGDTFTETFSTPATPASIVGTYPINPSVTGPNLANYIVSSNSGTLTISQAGTATTFALSNQNKTFTATVASLTSGMPTGTVAFYQGQTQVGSGTLTNGTASFTASTFPAGDVVVSAQYSGDADFTQSSSPPILVLSVAAANASLTVAAAGSVSDNVSVSPAPGYAGTVQLTCSGLPTNATCSFQPSSVAFSGTSNAAQVVLTIQTGVASQARFQSPHPDGDGGPNGIFLAAIWLPGIFTGIALGRGRKTSISRRNQMLMLLLLVCGLCAGLGGCGGTSSNTTHPSSASTPAGTYAVQLMASGGSGLTQTVGVSLTVQ